MSSKDVAVTRRVKKMNKKANETTTAKRGKLTPAQEEALRVEIKGTLPSLNEKGRRIFLGGKARTLGHGGIAIVMRISGAARNTIVRGIREHKEQEKKPDAGDNKRIRKLGGGRKKIKELYPEIKKEILEIVKSSTYGNPEEVHFHTTMSWRKIQVILSEKGYKIGHNVVGDLLKEIGYSSQRNQKLKQLGEQHPDRDKQFKYIKDKAEEFQTAKDPVISIDAKKKENIGNFWNNGAIYCPINNPVEVLDHDFPIPELGKVTPYGVYDIAQNLGFVNLGISKDTAEFAVESISRWWLTVGKNTYPDAKRLYINSDGGGSNGSRNRLFKIQLQDFANQSGLEVHVSHFPPGTSKWNKVEHRLFCYISSNWRGQPLISVEAAIDLIGSTTTTTGLRVKCIRDDRKYEIGIKVSDEELSKVNIKSDEVCSQWNYVISPNI